MDDIPLFPGVDKVVHFCMYGGMSGMLWLEFLRNHRKYETVLWHAWIGAVLCPIGKAAEIPEAIRKGKNIVRRTGVGIGLISWRILAG